MKNETKALNHVPRRRYGFLLTTSIFTKLSILVVLLVRQISSFHPISSKLRLRGQKKEILSLQKSTPTDTGIEDAIKLGRSEFEKCFQFPLDDWQFHAGGSILMGNNVIVCAPTGSGKTVVGEMALHAAFRQDLEGVYTTPLKALSNQKFSEFRQIFGNTNVGLSTGDVSINRDAARLTVMTTEVYRNIAWRSSGEASDSDNTSQNDLKKNSVVVLDEFHYMGQPGRGGVWEECVITSPAHTQIIGLSATLANAKELADWMTAVTGRYTELVEAPGARPVPLKYLFATREGIFPLFRNPDAGPGSPLGLLGYGGDGIPSTPGKPNESLSEVRRKEEDHQISVAKRIPKGLQINPALTGLAQRRIQKVNRMIERQKAEQISAADNSDESDWYSNRRKGRGRGRRSGPSFQLSSPREIRRERERLTRKEMRKAAPSLPILLTRLQEKELLPAIFFIFSRAGCDQTAETMSNAFKGPRDLDFNLNFQSTAKKSRRKKDTLGRKGGQERNTTKFIRKDLESNNGNDVLKDNQGRSFRLSSNNLDDDALNSVLDANNVFSESKFPVSGSPLSSDNWRLYSSAGLLNFVEVEEVAGLVAQFNEENPEISFPEDIIEQLLFGIGRHHAGMLPAHKMLIENLFRMNLMKAVFATETLAAGINMPARTTVICSLAKRGGSGSIALLETSNLLQMAGRAGRRGMDTTGTCVLVATPFEGEDVAATILTNPIEPISSQFRPSYSLALNLIARGNGRLNVAKQLVGKSFANWGTEEFKSSKSDGEVDAMAQASSEKFMNALVRVFDSMIRKRTAEVDVAFVAHLTELLKDRKMLKKSSKNFEAAKLTFELESTTLGCLELELKDSYGDEVSLFDEDEILQQVEEQRARKYKAEKKLKRHPFSSIASLTNVLLQSTSADVEELAHAFQNFNEIKESSSLDAEDIARFVKLTFSSKRKMRKLVNSNSGTDQQKLIEHPEDSAWKTMLAITRVLIAFGCIVPMSEIKKEYSNSDLEDVIFEVTPAGTDVGMLAFENSLWCFLAMGGTFDISNASAEFDEMKEAMAIYNRDDDSHPESHKFTDGDSGSDVLSKSEEEAETLLYNLKELSPGEIAGYVSCLVTGDTSRSDRLDTISMFKRLGPQLQRSIQVLLDITERFTDVQRQCLVDEASGKCQFDLSHCEVVTAWANGCSWNEALEISELAPGDLSRILGRATDALRQFGALKFHPVRKGDLNSVERGGVQPLSRGIHPEIRRLCREAAREMNRYPVKDPLPFDIEVDEIFPEDSEDLGGNKTIGSEDNSSRDGHISSTDKGLS